MSLAFSSCTFSFFVDKENRKTRKRILDKGTRIRLAIKIPQNKNKKRLDFIMKCAIIKVDDRGKFSCEPANPIKKLSPFFIDLRRNGSR